MKLDSLRSSLNCQPTNLLLCKCSTHLSMMYYSYPFILPDTDLFIQLLLLSISIYPSLFGVFFYAFMYRQTFKAGYNCVHSNWPSVAPELLITTTKTVPQFCLKKKGELVGDHKYENSFRELVQLVYSPESK